MLRDPVESTPEYQEAMKIIRREMKELPQWVSPAGYEAFQKKRLAQMGIQWRSPRELNPDIIFD